MYLQHGKSGVGMDCAVHRQDAFWETSSRHVRGAPLDDEREEENGEGGPVHYETHTGDIQLRVREVKRYSNEIYGINTKSGTREFKLQKGGEGL